MPLSPTPHDALFRALVSDMKRAAALLMEYLPPKVADVIDWTSPPQPVEGNLHRREGARTQCDALLHRLERRFGPVPPAAVDRIRAGSVDEITAWADVVLDAPSLEAVLDRGGR